MTLSAQERRQWNELERQLGSEDPRSAQLVRNRGAMLHMARAGGSVVASVVVLIVFLVVILAVIVKILLIGVLGFVLMLLGGTRFRPRGPEGQPARVSATTSGDVS